MLAAASAERGTFCADERGRIFGFFTRQFRRLPAVKAAEFLGAEKGSRVYEYSILREIQNGLMRGAGVAKLLCHGANNFLAKTALQQPPVPDGILRRTLVLEITLSESVRMGNPKSSKLENSLLRGPNMNCTAAAAAAGIHLLRRGGLRDCVLLDRGGEL